MRSTFTLTINDERRTFAALHRMPLLWVLRDLLALTGTKFGCGIGQCGACTVHLDGRAVRSCVLPVGEVGDARVTTIEAVGRTDNGEKVQHAWMEIEVAQCGYCQPGQIMAAVALLNERPDPSDVEIDAAMSGNLCRCGTYPRIREAIKLAATGKTDAVRTLVIQPSTHPEKKES
ncbi:(2Fe-2S)-binding protein [Rhizobium nepotum]|uniref:(2Fe-2S)-binding protein n=1 Tax=Rhizobium nepotum TaxID=1035271 RepID=UPI00336A1ED5